jgi:hypothetical protein
MKGMWTGYLIREKVIAEQSSTIVSRLLLVKKSSSADLKKG